jgi:cobalt-zinc-cadmium efflux system outer membrane protein
MNGKLMGAVSFVALGVAGCAQVKTDAQVDQALDLVEQRTGERPAWKAPWDEQPPAWDGQAVLRLQDAVALALRNNRDLRADLEMIAQADADLVQAGLLQNPTFNFMFMLPASGGRSMLRSNYLPMQPLQDLWLIPARKKVATAELQNAVLRVADRAVETAAAVKRVYARLQYTQRAIDLIRDNMRVADQSTRIIQIRQAAGKATQVETNLSHVRCLKLQSELSGMEAEHRTAQRELLMLMGLASATDRWQVEPVNELQDELEGPSPEDGLISLAADQRLDLKAARWGFQAAEERIDLMRREGWPEVALGFTFERAPAPRSNNQRFVGKLGNSAVEAAAAGAAGMPQPMPPVMPFNPKVREVVYTLGPMIDLELPIFDQNQAQVAKAISEYRQREAEYQARAQEITRMVRESRVMHQQAYDQALFYRRSVMPQVEQNLKLAQESFAAGQEDLTVYLMAQEDLIMTRLKTLSFMRDYHVTRAELERQVGGRLVMPEPMGPVATLPATTGPATTQAGE